MNTTITPNFLYKGPLIVPVIVNDGLKDSIIFEANISMLDPPIVAANVGYNIQENKSTISQNIYVSPPFGLTPSFSIIGGTDSLLFTIDQSGLLSFISSARPNYELPVALKNNGKIVVVGNYYRDSGSLFNIGMVIWQFTADGRIDTTFGDDDPADTGILRLGVFISQ